ncbi:uncharacterized protein [Lolium perenne]|uniref:uncharacterized protein n=1 Tax=Lolium perenne TaxID=4522 RepID=UPI003A999E9C
MQAALRHEQALKDARVAAEARLAEVVEDSTNSNTVLTAELEEERKSRKAAERLIDTMTTDHREYDRLVMKIDALALQHFPESQVYALKKVREDRIAREFPNLDAHWDGYDYLVALSARVQHMRSVDRLLADLPAAAIQVFKVLWPEEELPGNITLTAARLNDAGHRIHAPTDTDPALAAKRRDRAYRLAEYAETEKLKLGSPETPDEVPSRKRRAANVGHFQPDVGPDPFLRIIVKPNFDRLRIPHDFVRWFGEIPSNIIITTNTGCYWRMTTVMEGDDAYIDQGWAAFAVARQL